MFQVDEKLLNKIQYLSGSSEMKEYIGEQNKDSHMAMVYGMKKLKEQGLLTLKANRLYFYMMELMEDKYQISIDEIIYA